MKIKEIHYTTKRIPLKKPLFLRGQSFSHRDVIYLYLLDEKDRHSISEIAPLPGFSKETYEEVLSFLPSLHPQIVNEIAPETLEEFLRDTRSFIPIPSFAFALESALVQLYDVESPHELAHKKIKHSALIGVLNERLEEQIEEKMRQGMRTLKIKVGQNDMDEEIILIRKALQRFRSDNVKFRFDANAAWDLDELRYFGSFFLEFQNMIEYFEEPISLDYPIETLEKWGEESGFNVALDERLLGLDYQKALDALKRFQSITHIVLKPTLLGGFRKMYRLIKEADMLEKTAVLSSSFESPIGIRHIERLAQYAPDVDHGLDTLGYF